MEISKLKPFDNNNVSFKDNLKFIIPSLIGILLFMIPVKYEGDIASDHDDISMRKVKHFGYTIYHRISQSYYCVYAPQTES